LTLSSRRQADDHHPPSQPQQSQIRVEVGRADQIQNYLRDQMPAWKERYAGVEEMRVAVMGCIVNGPGESKHANIGISLPGTFEEPVAPVYVDGKLVKTLRGDHIVQEFTDMLNTYVERTYSAQTVETHV